MPSNAPFLLVEGNADDCSLIERAFHDAPPYVRFQRLSDCEEAMAYLEGEGPYTDRKKYPLPKVVLLDLDFTMPGSFAFLKWLRADKRNNQLLPTLVISSSAEPLDINYAYELGTNAYLTKPADYQDFTEQLRALALFWGKFAEIPQLSEP